MPIDIVVSKKSLSRLLEHAEKVADRKSAVPTLANVHLTADEKGLRVAATDLYLSVKCQTDAETLTPGAVTAPAKDLYERVKVMPDGPVQIVSVDDATVTVKAVGANRRFSVHGLPANDFPPLPAPKDGQLPVEIPTEVLATLMAQTHFSISGDETRAHVNSALFEWDGTKARMVSTDGHRLSKAECTVAGTSASFRALIPLKAISELRRLVDQARAEKVASVGMRQEGPNAFFSVGDIQFTVRLVDAQFPPYQQVIPTGATTDVRVSVDALRDALKAVMLAANDRTGGVKLRLVPGALRITSESPETGNAFDEISVDYSGKEMTVGLNGKYVNDVLNAVDAEEVLVKLSGELDPIVITPEGQSDAADYIAVVMPMRTT